MQEEKHLAALEEVRRALEEALGDPAGLLRRQRLLMAALSLGMQHIIEVWLHRAGAVKPGALIKHEWFASEERSLKLRLAGALTKELGQLPGHGRVLALAREVERNRNDIIYGSPLPTDASLREKIDLFLELKKSVEEATGKKVWQ